MSGQILAVTPEMTPLMNQPADGADLEAAGISRFGLFHSAPLFMAIY